MVGPASDLITAIIPLAARSRDKVRRVVGRSSSTPGGEGACERLINSFEDDLFSRLNSASLKTLAFELGAAAELGLLQGATPQSRFAFFVESLRDVSFSGALLQQYPALLRRLIIIIDHWEAATTLMLQRLDADLGKIRSTGLIESTHGALVSSQSCGDSHSGGQSVQILEFANGHRLVYKPRSVAMEAGVSALMRWANDAGLDPDLFPLNVLKMENYGWVSCVKAAPVAERAGLTRFYQRQGGNVAIAYFLGATDMHHENLVAAGEHPVIVDWEALFSPQKYTSASGATSAAMNLLQASVIGSMLLPTRRFYDDTPSGGKDISAVGFNGDKLGPSEFVDWSGIGTDEMALSKLWGVGRPSECLPTYEGETIAFHDFKDAIIDGFSRTYSFVMTNKSTLLSASGPLDAFVGERARYIFRDTQFYCKTLDDSWHPSFARDTAALEDSLRDTLERSDHGAGVTPAVIQREVADLLGADVPYFTLPVGRTRSRPEKPDVRGDRLVADGWQASRKRIRLSGEKDLERQLWLARAALTDAPDATRPATRLSASYRQRDVLSTAGLIGDRLCDFAVWEGEAASWLCVRTGGPSWLAPDAVDFDLHDGLSGIALFLARLAGRSGSDRHLKTAHGAMREALKLHVRARNEAELVNGLSGNGGFAYALALLGKWLKQPDWTEYSKTIIENPISWEDHPPNPDVSVGRAGFLLSGIAVATITKDNRLGPLLKAEADGLRRVGSDNLPADGGVGFAHGRAGIGFALMRWGQFADDPSFLAAGQRYIAEDLAILRQKQQFRDARAAHPIFAWCNGSPGAGHAALAAKACEPEELQWIVDDLEARFDEVEQLPLCLCHGLLGALAFLRSARQAGCRKSMRLSTVARKLCLGRVSSGELCSDVATDLENPGMFTGLAGTGYEMLRWLDPSMPMVPMLGT